MIAALAKIKEDYKKKPIFSRVLTNRMTIIGWRLFKSSHRLHLALIIYRLKRDFGFTEWEIANFTGIPVRDIHNFMRKFKPLLDTEVLKVMAELEYTYQDKINAWMSLPRGHDSRPQGYYIIKDYPAWYENTKKYKRWVEEPGIKLGKGV